MQTSVAIEQNLFACHVFTVVLLIYFHLQYFVHTRHNCRSVSERKSVTGAIFV